MLTTTAAGRTFDYNYCIGMLAMSGAGFTFPVDFVMSANGVVYVINRAAEGLNQRISKCTVDHEFIGQYGSPGAGDGQFTWPMSIDLDQDENVYVCDEYLQRISIFDCDGKFLHKWGTPGSGEGELNGPSGLAFDRDDNLYIVDSLNHRVQKFTKDGKFLAKWGQHGSGEGEFDTPWGLCLDRQGDVYVADWKKTAGCRNFPPTAITWPPLPAPSPVSAPFTAPPAWPSIRKATSMSPTGRATSCRSLPRTASSSPPWSGMRNSFPPGPRNILSPIWTPSRHAGEWIWTGVAVPPAGGSERRCRGPGVRAGVFPQPYPGLRQSRGLRRRSPESVGS